MEYFKISLEQLQTDYLDLYLFHVPSAENASACPLLDSKGQHLPWADCRRQSWTAMEDLYKSGKIRYSWHCYRGVYVVRLC